MCGIAGYYHKAGAPIGSTEDILNMLRLQKHRGPDDSGVMGFSLTSQITTEYNSRQPQEVDRQLEGVLGFNRLSILDLSMNGHQPMRSSDGKVALVFNGEIYNAFDYKQELESKGYHFRSHTDTEVILALYLIYGFEEMITRLNGMFAIVLVDTRSQQLFLARDRFGIKPLYLLDTSDRLAFASELKSFLVLSDFVPTLNDGLLDEFLIFRNVRNQTLFRGVECLEPGTFKVYSPQRSFTKHFFLIDSYKRVSLQSSMSDTLDQLSAELRNSVHRQLVSDVKVGCQLSGGIDSSLVTMYAQEEIKVDLLETISIVFDQESFTEEPYINQVTKSLRLDAHKYTLDADTYLQHFVNATWHFESPLNHPNTIGIYHLSKEARKHVTVLLSGEGADEVFGGYDRFGALMHPYRPKTYLRELKKNRNALWLHLTNYHNEANRSVSAAGYMSYSLARLLKPDFSVQQAHETRMQIYNCVSGSSFDRQVKYEMLTYLPDLLIRQDKMSMAHSIENRVPFLDNELVDHSFKIQSSRMMGKTSHGEQTKLALKQLAEMKWGESFAYRSKSGFGIPLRDYFSTPLFRSYLMDEVIPGMQKRSLFEIAPVRNWVNRIDQISSRELDALWIMISFEVWASRYKIAS